MCWDDSEVQLGLVGDGLQNADEAEKRVVGGRREMVGEVPRCLTMKTTVHHGVTIWPFRVTWPFDYL